VAPTLKDQKQSEHQADQQGDHRVTNSTRPVSISRVKSDQELRETSSCSRAGAIRCRALPSVRRCHYLSAWFVGRRREHRRPEASDDGARRGDEERQRYRVGEQRTGYGCANRAPNKIEVHRDCERAAEPRRVGGALAKREHRNAEWPVRDADDGDQQDEDHLVAIESEEHERHRRRHARDRQQALLPILSPETAGQ